MSPMNSSPDDQAPAADTESDLPNAVLREDLRRWADFFCIWRLCDRTGCRRALRCRGRSHVCFPRYAPLLPDDLKTWCLMFGEARTQGLSYDEAMEDIGASPVGEALSNWHLAVAASLCAPPRRPRRALGDDAAATDL